MLKPTPTPAPTELETVCIDQLVPQKHLLRLIDRYLRFDFIRERTQHLYCADNGRPAVDPVLLFKMLFIGYLFGIRSERQLVREVEVNVAYRWFLGLRLTDKVPDHSTFSQNRRRRFSGTDIEQVIFDEIVQQAVSHHLIGGRVLYTDSTHLKAKANKKHFKPHQVQQTPQAYLETLNAEVEAARTAQGKTRFPSDDDDEPPPREIKVSTVDPDAGYMTRDGKPQGFFYLDHRTVDGRHALIVDSFVTPANVHDSQPYLGRLQRIRERFDFEIDAVGLDAGYFTPWICKSLIEQGIFAVIGYQRPPHRKGYYYKRDYRYDAKQNAYRCPVGQTLRYRTTNRQGYREYVSSPRICLECPSRPQCTKSRNGLKVVLRHLWENFKEQVTANRLHPIGKRLYARRRETVERSFADAKELHGQRYARFKGLARVQAQCLLAAACQNMKKIALLLACRALRWLISTIKFGDWVVKKLNQTLRQREGQFIAGSPATALNI